MQENKSCNMKYCSLYVIGSILLSVGVVGSIHLSLNYLFSKNIFLFLGECAGVLLLGYQCLKKSNTQLGVWNIIALLLFIFLTSSLFLTGMTSLLFHNSFVLKFGSYNKFALLTGVFMLIWQLGQTSAYTITDKKGLAIVPKYTIVGGALLFGLNYLNGFLPTTILVGLAGFNLSFALPGLYSIIKTLYGDACQNVWPVAMFCAMSISLICTNCLEMSGMVTWGQCMNFQAIFVMIVSALIIVVLQIKPIQLTPKTDTTDPKIAMNNVFQNPKVWIGFFIVFAYITMPLFLQRGYLAMSEFKNQIICCNCWQIFSGQCMNINLTKVMLYSMTFNHLLRHILVRYSLIFATLFISMNILVFPFLMLFITNHVWINIITMISLGSGFAFISLVPALLQKELKNPTEIGMFYAFSDLFAFGFGWSLIQYLGTMLFSNLYIQSANYALLFILKIAYGLSFLGFIALLYLIRSYKKNSI